MNNIFMKSMIQINQSSKNQIINYNQNIFIHNMLINRIITRRSFSVLNKVKQNDSLKKGILNRPVMKSYLLDDFVGQANYQLEKHKLSPHQRYLIETKAMERPFTGMFWAENQTGFYHCAVCNTRLFSFDSKFESKTGFATFWRGVQNRVKIIDEENPEVNFDNVNYARFKADYEQQNFKRCECAQCKSHIGVVYFDGPPPSFLRFSINSSLLKFEPLREFEDPNIRRKEEKIRKRENRVEYIK